MFFNEQRTGWQYPSLVVHPAKDNSCETKKDSDTIKRQNFWNYTQRNRLGRGIAIGNIYNLMVGEDEELDRQVIQLLVERQMPSVGLEGMATTTTVLSSNTSPRFA